MIPVEGHKNLIPNKNWKNQEQKNKTIVKH